MMLPRTATRAIAMLFGLALLAGLGGPARAIEPYPGETREAFVARSALDQQRKLADADAAASELTPGLAGGGDSGGAFKFGMFGLVALALGALRLSRGIVRASRAITRTGGVARGRESFEDRLAEKLRELERGTPATPQQVSPAPAPAPAPVASPPAEPFSAPTPRLASGPRTFGRRVT